MTGKAGRPPRAPPAPPAGRPPQATRRVYLRPLTAADAAAFSAAVRASVALHRPWVHPPATAAAFRRWLLGKCDDGTWASLLVLRSEDHALAGICNLSQIIRGPLQQAFLGYYAFAPHAGRGYMREGLELTLAHAFGKLKLHRIEANIQPGNRPSIALAAACGFVREGYSPRYLKIAGRWRDHERWAIRAEDWKARRRAAPRPR